MKIYCCNCRKEIQAKAITGRVIYPHRKDLYKLPFWQCPSCKGYVGCHHKSDDPTKPLGCIASPEVKNARQHIHRLIDPLWQEGHIHRKHLYNKISKRLGFRYHTADIRSVDEARIIYKYLLEIKEEVLSEHRQSK